MMKRIVLTASVVSVAVAAGFWTVRYNSSSDFSREVHAQNASKPLVAGSNSAGLDSNIESPFGVVDSDILTLDNEGGDPTATSAVELERGANAYDDNTATPSWDSPLSEAQLVKIVARLNADPVFFQQLMDEFRQTTNPEVKKRLAMVLGAVGGDQATLLASELIFSGDSDERTLGMDLLQSIQPGNAQARDIVSGMLATEVEPDVLIDAMTALSTPGEVDSDSRAFLSDQLAWLTTHQDDGVRSISLDILSRWSDDDRYTNILVAGLDDTSEYVRGSAAYALAGHEDTSAIVIDSLFSALKRAGETESVKRAAVLALRSMPLSSNQQAELNALERRLNTVPR